MTTSNLAFKLAGREVNFAMNLLSIPPVLRDQEMLYAIRVGGIPEPEVSDLMARAAKPGSFVIDGGANIGFFTVLLSRLVGPDGHVVAIEPGANNIYRTQGKS